MKEDIKTFSLIEDYGNGWYTLINETFVYHNHGKDVIMNYYVLRINYNEPAYSMLKDELLNGKLRQGWGSINMSVNQRFEDYEDAWHTVWGENDADSNYIFGKYNNIHLMTEMNVGDIIIIPKLNIFSEDGWTSFTIARCTGSYQFDPILDNFQDFGHIIPIELIASYTYAHNSFSRIISGKFKAYQRPVNHVYNDNFISAVQSLIQEYNDDPNSVYRTDLSPIESLSAPTSSEKMAYLNKIVEQINLWQPNQLEKIIEELFVMNGFEKKANNRYDKKGGDIDLVFAPYPKNSLMHHIYATSGSLDMQELRVQAKNKSGQDTNDLEGVYQLAQMDGHESSINILINTTINFSDEAKEEAAKKSILLINGTEFASLLVKFGLDILE